MTNPASHPRELYLKLTRGSTGGIIEFRYNSSNKTMDFRPVFTENRATILNLTIENSDRYPARNLLSSSCALWSGAVTGALQLGDGVEYGLYQTDGITVDILFEGHITDTPQQDEGRIIIVAYDPSRRMDFTKIDRVFSQSERNLLELSLSLEGGYGYKYVHPTDLNIVLPLKYAAISTGMSSTLLGQSGAGTLIDLALDTDYAVAQSFLLESWGRFVITFYYTTVNYKNGGVPYSIIMELHRDENNSVGALVCSDTKQCATGDDTNASMQFLATSQKLVPREKYWVVFKANHEGTGSLKIKAGTVSATASVTDLCLYYDGSVWAPVDMFVNSQLKLNIYHDTYSEMEPGDYYFDSGGSQVIFLKNTPALPDYTPYFGAAGKGYLSYYYGTMTLEELILKLLKLGTGMLGNVNANCDRTFQTYYTKGKSIGDCLRETMDVFENSGTWSGRQHVMTHYIDGSGVNRLKIGKRLDTTHDSEVATFSHPEDRPSNSDEWLIVGNPQLTKTTKMRYSKVMVIGKDYLDMPIVAVRSDRAKTGSMWEKMHGVVETLTVTDDNLRTLEDCNREAYRLLDAVTRDVWEGKITLYGHHTALWDFDNTSDSYGSGKIIKLYWSPLGISNMKMKITGIEFTTYTTIITVNNTDMELLNRVTRGLGNIDRLESLTAVIGDPESLILEYYYYILPARDGDTYMRIYDDTNTLMTPQDGQLCTKFANTDYNSRTYHAEFERTNCDGANKVRYVELYDSTGILYKFDLMASESCGAGTIDVDLKISKYRSHRLIVEINLRNA